MANDFDRVLVATASAFTEIFGETVTYYPRVGDSREIIAVVNREGLQAVEGLPGGRSVLLTIDVENDAETGISSDEIDCGGDEISVPVRIGETASKRTIAKILAQDAGRMNLAVW